MDRLNLLTEKLIDISTITEDSNSGIREYKVEKGSAFAIALKHNSEVAVVQSFMSSGTIFPYHNHSESDEVLVVYHGTIAIITDEKRMELKPGDSIHICKGCGHLLHAHTDVKIIAITIPPDSLAMPKKKEDKHG